MYNVTAYSVFALSLCLISVSNGADPWLTIEGKEGIGKGQNIVFVTGEEYYRSEEGMAMFAQIMARHHGFRCTVLFAIDPATGFINPNRNGNIPGLESLQSADLMVLFARFRELPDADMKHIVEYVNAGKPVLGIRNATHAFRYAPTSQSLYKDWDFQSKNWPGGFGQQILGDTWIAHFGQFQKEATLASMNITQANNPVLKGVADTIFCHTDVNSVERLSADDTVLFHGQVLAGLNPTDPPVSDHRKETRMPFAWFKTYTAPSGKQGRSFATTAGASLDWQNEDLRRLMANAMLALTGHEKQIPEKTNVSFVSPYTPGSTGALPDEAWTSAKLTPDRWSLESTGKALPPYDTPLLIEPPYYRVRYSGSPNTGELPYPVSFMIWVPPGVKVLRGVVVHQHGCGEGSCISGQTGALDLHWQALAKKHDCALMSPTYEQPDKANCQLWCDPRNGSDAAFQKSLVDLGMQSNHPELASIPWAIWGHSGGGYWAGGMMLLHPDRVAAAWLRSGVPPLTVSDGKPLPYVIPDAALNVPVMCNLGTKEGVTVKDGQFAGVWKGAESFFLSLRSKGGLIGISIDPLSSHECGNQRYLSIPWFDACLSARLPVANDGSLKPIARNDAWLTPLDSDPSIIAKPVRATDYLGSKDRTIWLPNETIANAWSQYVTDTAITDSTPPPAPTNLRIQDAELTWDAEADLESGLASFIIERDGKFLANHPDQGKNPYGRPIFQRLQYSDTPVQPIVRMQFNDSTAEKGKSYEYRVFAMNTVGLKSVGLSSNGLSSTGLKSVGR